MPVRIGMNFGNELIAAGLGGLPISFSDDGTVTGLENLTPAQRARLRAVVLGHDPTVPLQRTPAQKLAASGLSIEELVILMSRHYGFSHGRSIAGGVSA